MLQGLRWSLIAFVIGRKFALMNYASRITLVCIALGLAGCGGPSSSLPNPLKAIPNPFKRSAEAEPAAIAPPVLLEDDLPETDLGAAGQTPDALDNTSAADLARAADVSGGNGLGETIASLGDPTQAGLWLRTPLVASETPGRLQAANGQSLAVTLIPIEGEPSSGSRISLSAMRGLGLGLTDLPVLKVFRVTASS